MGAEPAQQYDCGIAFIGIGRDVYEPIVERLGLEERLPGVAVDNTYTVTRLGDDIDQISTTAMMYIATEATMAMGSDLRDHLCAGLQRVTANPANHDRIYLYDATTGELKQITPNGTINISLSETNGGNPLVGVVETLFGLYRTEDTRALDTDENLGYEVDGPESKADRDGEEIEIAIEDPETSGNGDTRPKVLGYVNTTGTSGPPITHFLAPQKRAARERPDDQPH